MYAVVQTGSKQYRVEAGVELLVEKLEAEPGQSVELSEVLLYAEGDTLSVGTPRVAMTVLCKCLGHEQGPKLHTIKYRRRKNYRRTMGHRQTYTRLLVESFAKKGN